MSARRRRPVSGRAVLVSIALMDGNTEKLIRGLICRAPEKESRVNGNAHQWHDWNGHAAAGQEGDE